MMSNEEIERKMAFIVGQQAQFASDIQLLQESQARTEQVVAHTAEVVAHTADAVAQTADAVGQTADAVGQTAEVVARLANVTHVGFNDVNAKINALVDSQIRTDETVRNLVAVVDRYFREGSNGHSL
jgi:ABC-type transporter Mla subunit MlaD